MVQFKEKRIWELFPLALGEGAVPQSGLQDATKSHSLTANVALSWPVVATAGLIWFATLIMWGMMPTPPANPDVQNRLTPIGIAHWSPDYDLPVYLMGGAAAVVATTITVAWRVRHTRRGPTHTPSSNASFWRVLDVVVPLVILGIVWVPDATIVAGEAFKNDSFHHINFFAMAPMQAFRQGSAFGTSVYCQYGCGWALLLSLCGTVYHLDYSLMYQLLTSFGALYFVSVYLALRLITRDPIWATVGVLSAVEFQLFNGTYCTLWIYPSSTVARCPLDIFLMIALLKLGRTMHWWWGVIAGSLTGLSLLFGVDTGVYMIAGSCGASLLMLMHFLRCRDITIVKMLALCWTAGIASFFISILIASRGTELHRDFWTGYFEVLFMYPNGISSLPISQALGDRNVVTILISTVMIYTLTLAGACGRAIAGRSLPDDFAVAQLSIVGFGTLLLFVNRSHPYNIYHPMVPSCVLGTILLQSFFRYEPLSVTLTSWMRNLIPLALIGIVLVAILNNRFFWEYPSAFASWLNPNPNAPVLRSILADKIKAIEAVGQELDRELAGLPYDLLGDDPTLWQVTLNKPVLGRYSPPYPVTKAQEQRILDDINVPRVVVVRDPDLRNQCGLESRIKTKYRMVSETSSYSVWERN